MAEVTQPVLGARARRPWAWHLWSFAKRKPLGAIGAVILIVVVLTAILANFIGTIDPNVQDVSKRLTAPNTEFWFGSDEFGRDMYSRIVYGARISLYVGLVAVTIGTTVGVVVGIASPYFGGWVDLVVQRVIDAMEGFPGLVLALALVTALGASLNNVVLAIAIAFTPRMTRLTRSMALSVKEEDYILASRAVGSTNLRIMVRHVLPNSLAPVIVLATGYLGTAIIVEAGLSFLGLGVPPPHSSWGRMLQGHARRWSEEALWLMISPGAALALTVFGFNLFGDALRDVLDPHLRGR